MPRQQDTRRGPAFIDLHVGMLSKKRGRRALEMALAVTLSATDSFSRHTPKAGGEDLQVEG